MKIVFYALALMITTVTTVGAFQNSTTPPPEPQITYFNNIQIPSPTMSPKPVYAPTKAQNTPVATMIPVVNCHLNFKEQTHQVTQEQCNNLMAQDKKDADSWLASEKEKSRIFYEQAQSNMNARYDSIAANSINDMHSSPTQQQQQQPLPTYDSSAGLKTYAPIVLNTPTPNCAYANGVQICQQQ